MTIMQKTENFYMQEQSKHMPKADAVLYFVIEEKNRSVELTDNGRMLLGKGAGDERLFVMDDIGGILNDLDKNETISQEEVVKQKDVALVAFQEKNERLHALRQLLKAYTLFHREDEYVVINNQVKIVDEQTGRMMEGRRFSDGLHQALEALDEDRAFLKKGEVFSDDLIDGYIDLKSEEVQKYEMTPHPVEYEMYYSV